MTLTKAYAAYQAKEILKPFELERRTLQPHDVLIDIYYCGVCHSDIHQVHDDWGTPSIFPMVPGHEIVGKIIATGDEVQRHHIGDYVGVGCFIDSCRNCHSCKSGIEQYCDQGMNSTYNSFERDGKTPTYGGYSQRIVVDENYVLKIPAGLPLDAAAPLLCAGITCYSPLRYCQIKPGDKVAIVGLGGLGHMAVKLANAMGADVTVLSTSSKKKEDAFRLGAKNYALVTEPSTFQHYANSFDLIINTVSAAIDLNAYLTLLKLDGTMVMIGIPETGLTFHPLPLIFRRRKLLGSLIGGIKETQEMLDFCVKHNITSDIELIKMEEINNAYERMIKGDVRYRFVIDIKKSFSE